MRWPVWARSIGVRWMARHDRTTLLALLDPASCAARGSSLKARLLRSLARSLESEETFSLIYNANLWGKEESRSGAGSTIEETAAIRASLPLLCKSLGVRSLLDVPCGDFNWMRQVDLAGIDYLGADIVPEIVAHNKRDFARPGRDFIQLDLLTDDLPLSDAVLCRDCLVHLPFTDGLQALQNIYTSGARYLFSTTFPALMENHDVARGFWRPLNLERPPFSLPPALELLRESNPDPRYADKSLGVWRIGDLS